MQAKTFQFVPLVNVTFLYHALEYDISYNADILERIYCYDIS
jgi:hypothetical protein